MPELRKQHRVSYQTGVQIRSVGRADSLVATVHNLGAQGIFVTGADVPAAGTPVQCRMLVGGEGRVLAGRVAWVSRRPRGVAASAAATGAGIEFVDLSPRDSDLIRQVVAPASHAAPVAAAPVSVPVDVKFEGLPAAIRSHAEISADGLHLSTQLPFLRLRSSVVVTFVRDGVEESRTGTIHAVTLEPTADGGIPRLKVAVAAPAVVRMPINTFDPFDSDRTDRFALPELGVGPASPLRAPASPARRRTSVGIAVAVTALLASGIYWWGAGHRQDRGRPATPAVRP